MGLAVAKPRRGKKLNEKFKQACKIGSYRYYRWRFDVSNVSDEFYIKRFDPNAAFNGSPATSKSNDANQALTFTISHASLCCWPDECLHSSLPYLICIQHSHMLN